MCSGSAGFKINILYSSLSPLSFATLAPWSLRSALFASAFSLTLMQSERPLALLRHPYPAPCVSPLQYTAFAYHLLSFRLQAFPERSALSLSSHCCWNTGPWATADVVWRAVRSEIQCIIMLSEDIMMEASQSETQQGDCIILHPSFYSISEIKAYRACEGLSVTDGSWRNWVGACFDQSELFSAQNSLLERFWQDVLWRAMLKTSIVKVFLVVMLWNPVSFSLWCQGCSSGSCTHVATMFTAV